MRTPLGALLGAALCAVACGSRTREPEPTPGPEVHLREIAPAAGDAWRKLMAAEGLGAHVAALEPKVRPAIRLTTTPSRGFRVGQSRFGGRPDLPAGFTWPRFASVPLAFLAQIDLSELPTGSARGALPESGHLWFFYVADQSTWGFDPKDAGSARVFYAPAGPALTPAARPKQLPEDGEFESAVLGFEAYDDPPDLDADPPPIRLADGDSERYHGVRSYLATADVSPSHKLLGHPQPVQGAMEEEVALVTGGVYCGDASCYSDPRAAKLKQDAGRWRLLLQVDTDDKTSMMWGDAGMLYFWIREDDLQARRFDRTWTILQCY
jgi:uncharacterized protein YwqG